MKKIFLDTNLFIRYLVNDIPEQADKVDKLFHEAEKGKLRLITGPPVFFEIVWTLKSFYGVSRQYIYDCLMSVLGIQGLEVLDIEIVEQALELYRNTNTDFADAYIAASAKGAAVNMIATFNKNHFKNLQIPLYNL